MIVVDTNVLAHLFLPTVETVRAEELFKRDSDWVVPLLWRSEFRSVLSGYMRRKTLTAEQACSLQAEAESLLSGNEYAVDSRRVFDLVERSNCSAYDCEFVALAMQLDVKLFTLDSRLLRAFPALVQSLASV